MKNCNGCPSLLIVRKCCFCVPVRKGVTIFAYINLVLTLLSIPLFIFILVEEVTEGKAIPGAGRMNPLLYLSFTVVFIAVDCAMTILLIVGAHKRNRGLLKAYLYFGVVFQTLSLILDLVYFNYWEIIENFIYFIVLGFNIYLYILVYSTLRVIEESREVQYVSYENHQLHL